MLRKRSRGTAFERAEARLFWPFVLPATLLYLIFFIGPAIASVFISFHKWDGISTMEWVGIGNYTRLVQDEVFQRSFVNTLVLLIGGGLVVFVLSFALTMVLREMRGRKFVRQMLFFPNIVSAIVLAFFWGFIFQAGGLLENALRAAGVDSVPQLLLTHPFAVIFAGIMWTSLGYYITILMAGVDRIPNYYYEAARLDGASAWSQFVNVTLPLTWDVIATTATLWTISSLKIFEFILTFGAAAGDLPNRDVWNTAMFIYGRTFGGLSPQLQFGYASAAAVVTVVTVVVFVALLRRLMRRDSLEF
ncbi:carbohydrate ABC transporter permease [uncultured Tessaracoccus sp.]|uniref:carbohydrate ABC transporter permease n=1 Tax=uncultured Tessaracoccus sp. TaxID=905023 RepID=UPI0025EFA5DA|nr:sugar ABC transporter permease [uncultured Tessaracoccus sp.]